MAGLIVVVGAQSVAQPVQLPFRIGQGSCVLEIHAVRPAASREGAEI